MTKTINEQIKNLKSATQSLSEFKNEASARGKEIYKDYQSRIPEMIAKLEEQGVAMATHPEFAEAIYQYNYWK